jgi:hypothetical protein
MVQLFPDQGLYSEAQHLDPDVVVSSGCCAHQAKAVFTLAGRIQTTHVETAFLQEGEIPWGVVLAYSAGIFTEADVDWNLWYV